MDFIIGRPLNKSIWSIIHKLVIGVVVYVIWQERNVRIFQGKSRSVEVICSIVKDLVRLRLLSLKFKNSKQVLQVAEVWNIQVKQRNVNMFFSDQV